MKQSVVSIAPFFLLFIVPIFSAAGLLYGGQWFWATPVFAFVLIPSLDFLVGDHKSPYLDPSTELVQAGRALTVLYVPVHLALIGFGVYQSAYQNWSTLEWTLAVLGVGMSSGGLGITIAHELVHRSEKFLRTLGGVLLSSVCYGHFMVEHVHGHHTWVATPKDPASARFGENLYSFYLRTVVGSFASALKIESEWIKKRNRSWFQNRVFLTFALSFIFALAAYAFTGANGLLFFVLQAWVGFTFLEIINYVEHYGLARKQLENGSYEPVQFKHSWDSRKKISNWFLINLERHSDHHKYPTRDFTALRYHDEAPTLPAGYPEMVILSLFPPLWFKIMNRRVQNVSH